MLNNLGNWWNGGQPSAATNPLAGYADRMRAAGAAAPVTSPLVAAYTPPAYQTTPPHVDINAVIAAMNAQKAAQQPAAATAPVMPMSQFGGGEGLGEMGGGTSAGMEMAGLEREAAGNAAGGAAGLAMGGPVMPQNLTGPNPPGPDEGYAPLKTGEFVVRKDAVKTVGKKPLEKINESGSEKMATKIADRVAAKNDRDEPKAKGKK